MVNLSGCNIKWQNTPTSNHIPHSWQRVNKANIAVVHMNVVKIMATQKAKMIY